MADAVADDIVPTGAGPDPGLDVLRATLMLLVRFHHFAITYGVPDDWRYQKAGPTGSPRRC